MKRNVLRYALPVAVLFFIPSFFNSCKGGFMGVGSSSSKKACKVGIENGVFTKMEYDGTVAPAPFAGQKVKLREDSLVPLPSKATALNLSKGDQLSVLVDNACLLKGGLDNTVISKAAAASGTLSAEMDRQAYNWELDRDYNEAEIEDLANQDPCVFGVTWDHKYKIAAMSFNDSSFPNQSHFPAIRAQEAYDYFYGATGGITGQPVIIAVADTGVDWGHPDLSSNMWVHSQGVGIDITTLGTALVDYNPADVSDIGHGTHVSGLIAAVSNNNVGVVGAMPFKSKIMAIKVFKRESNGDLTTTSTHFYNALKFAVLNKANVINLSLGSVQSGARSDSMALSGVQEALQGGVVVVTVIGNADSGNGVNIDGVNMSSIPGQYGNMNGVITVGSIDVSGGAKSYFSHYSTIFTDIAAPGADAGNTGLYSTLPRAMSSYGRLAGTSQAAPLVAAAAGLAFGLFRDLASYPPTPAQVENMILSSAVKDPQLTPYFKQGNRLDMLNLYQTVKAGGMSAVTGSASCN